MRKCRKIYVYYLKIKITTVQTNHTDCNGQYYVKKIMMNNCNNQKICIGML